MLFIDNWYYISDTDDYANHDIYYNIRNFLFESRRHLDREYNRLDRLNNRLIS